MDELRKIHVSYVFLGEELGARPRDPSCYVDGKVQFDRLARAEIFQIGLTRVLNGSKRHRIALLCAERDPLICHRAILVCRYLVQLGIAVQHIRSDGSIEEHDDALTRLLMELNLSADMFRSYEELVADAYDRRAAEIAYVAPKMNQRPSLRNGSQ
jgi:uncharacterized protein (DUF488 family)